MVPIFDHTRPCLPRYFKQLEAPFNRRQVTSDVERKDFTTSYLTGYVAEAWEALPEFTSPNSTYEHLRDRLSNIYNFSVLRYTLPNLAELISHHQLTGFQSLQDLTKYHLKFVTVHHLHCCFPSITTSSAPPLVGLLQKFVRMPGSSHTPLIHSIRHSDVPVQGPIHRLHGARHQDLYQGRHAFRELRC